MNILRRGVLSQVFAVGLGLVLASPAALAKDPVVIGLDGEFGLPNSISAQAIETGIRIALDEINRAGGVLGGRALVLEMRDNRSMPARGIANIKEFAKNPNLVAVMLGRFSPVVLEEIPVFHETKMIGLAPWSSADGIITNNYSPNYMFRLSLRDSLAMPKMLDHSKARGFKRIGLLLTNTAWGRSNEAAATQYLESHTDIVSAGTVWSNWRAKSLIKEYQDLRARGAEAIVLVVNDDEAATLLKEMQRIPANERLPIVSHWGVTGGTIAEQAGDALFDADFSVIQTVSFFKFQPERLAKFMESAKRAVGLNRIEDIQAPVGIAHAYDLTHILARAIALAGSTDRAKIRDVLERVTDYDGLIRHFDRPFAPDRHEALGPNDLLLVKFARDGTLRPIE